MNQPVHPSLEQVSDLLAGAAPPELAQQWDAHLESCADCQGVRDALLNVTSVLADEGAAEDEMPADVSAALGVALAQASRDRRAGVTSLDSVRRPTEHRALRWLAGAAAAVVVIGLAVTGLRAWSPSNSSNTSSSEAGRSTDAGAAHAQAGSGQVPSTSRKAAPASPFSAADGLPTVTAGTVAATAGVLAHHPGRAVPPQSAGCAAPAQAAVSGAVRFRGRIAVLAVQPATGRAVVYDCATARRVLFSTSY